MASHRAVTTEDQVPYLTRPCGCVGYQSGIGTGFSTEQGPVLFPRQYHSTNIPHSFIHLSYYFTKDDLAKQRTSK